MNTIYSIAGLIIQNLHRGATLAALVLIGGCATLPPSPPVESPPGPAAPAMMPNKQKNEPPSPRRRALAQGQDTQTPPLSGTQNPPPRETEPSLKPARATPPVAKASASERPTPVEKNTSREAKAPIASTPAHTDIWGRLRSGFALRTRRHPRIDRQLRWLKRNKEYLYRALRAGRPYLHFILEETAKRRMPSEFALLPVIESGFRPFAYSPSRAAGIWQFVRSTARQHGVKQNWWYEGRRDIVTSTWAALDHLQMLAKKYDGDWELALAAYNSGVGTVYKARRHNRRQGRKTGYWSLTLPKETQNYVPRLLAIARIIKNPSKYGFHLPKIPNRPYFRMVDTGGQLDISLAAQLAGIPLGEMQHLNPGWRRWATDPTGPHRLLIPVDKVARFQRKLAALAPDKRVSWTRYHVRPGDNLSTIAAHHGTTSTILRQSNGLRSSRIRAGQLLLIPLPQQALAHSRPSPRPHVGGHRSRFTHTVRRGESLWILSRRYGVGYLKLAKWNHLSGRCRLKPGQKLTIWAKNDDDNPVQGPLIASLEASQAPRNYRVKKGDSLSHIAHRFKVSVTDIRRWNTLSGERIRPGQTLTLFPR